MSGRNFYFQRNLLIFIFLSVVVFHFVNTFRLPPYAKIKIEPNTQIVISAPIQLLMYAGDRFLASDFETIRVAASGTSETPGLMEYRVRAYELISQLNSCHEDNYYLANAMLSWGGSQEAADIILERATRCRTWDYVPPFFQGFNKYFFLRDIDGASKYMNIAAERSEENRSIFRKTAIVMASEVFNDEAAAVEYLRHERDNTKDPKLALLLNRRLKRLEGLIILRRAHADYENNTGKHLQDINELLASGFLSSIPEDPTRIGYELTNGIIQLRALTIGGIEVR